MHWLRRLLIISGCSFLFLLFLTNCRRETPPEYRPPTNCEYTAGNRTFTWRLDTVAWWPSTVGGVWAFSDSDAYVMGYIVDGRPPYTLRAGRHWNGSVWEDNINGTWGVNGDIKIDPRNGLIGDEHFMVCVGWYGISTTEYAGVAEFDNRTKRWRSHLFQTVGQLRCVWTDGNGFFIAAGDNGMVYTRDGYTAGWVFSQAPTNFHFTRIVGVSRSEMYARAGVSLMTGSHFQQIWKYANSTWIKLMDNQDTTGMPIQIPGANDGVYEVAASRCSITDSLYLYVVGQESFEFRSRGSSLSFTKENLASRGLPLSLLGLPAGTIVLFSPSDFWVSSLRYHLYHWNGSNFQKIEPIPSLPYGQLWGSTWRIGRNPSGKTWMVLEMGSQVYAVLQGVPN